MMILIKSLPGIKEKLEYNVRSQHILSTISLYEGVVMRNDERGKLGEGWVLLGTTLDGRMVWRYGSNPGK